MLSEAGLSEAGLSEAGLSEAGLGGAGHGAAIAAAARALIGVRFRRQGRDPAHGLDCVGLVLCALAGGGVRVDARRDYPARGGSAAAVTALIEDAGLVRVRDAAAGDVLLAAVGAGQLHLGIVTDAGIVHADAGLRRVVERPGPVPWPVIGTWRGGWRR